MDTDQTLLFDEAIKLELKVGELYSLFASWFKEDYDFWWNLALEENNHASLIRSVKEHFQPAGIFPKKLLSFSLPKMVDTNKKLTALIEKYKANPPQREETFRVAIDIETSGYEIHYQEFMAGKAESAVDNLFQDLNSGDKDHADRIKNYMISRGLQP
jgi:hypothetical protein